VEISKKEEIRISKFLSLILRHQPEEIDLTLDEWGWANIKELVFKSNKNGINIDFKKLYFIVHHNDKKRFIFNHDLTKIRASQGHSLKINLQLSTKNPPKYLYHGTAIKNLNSIKKYGINKNKRQYVHLSNDFETARIIGSRHGTPCVLRIDAEKMKNDGYKFFISENSIWLTDYISINYIEFDF
jgi:putative RNA 2'-phosphotransferase